MGPITVRHKFWNVFEVQTLVNLRIIAIACCNVLILLPNSAAANIKHIIQKEQLHIKWKNKPNFNFKLFLRFTN